MTISSVTCPSPVAHEIPIRNTSLSDNISRRGAFISIGNPDQSLAFHVNPQLNNTYIYDNVTHSNRGGCNATGTVECAAQFGGLYDENASTTWSFANSSASSTVPEDPTVNPSHHTDLWGADTLTVAPQVSLKDFTLGVSRGEGETMNTLALGQNSTLLQRLVDDGTISSKTWGYWHGWTGANVEHQHDGSLIFGGYDSAKVMGPNVTLATNDLGAIEANCYRVRIKDVTMNLKNGSALSILDASKSTEKIGCVFPNFDTLSLPKAMWDSFLAISGSTYVERSASVINWWGMLVEAQGAYDGDLTISIDQGLNDQSLDITIPNHQLVVPNTRIDSSGQTLLVDDAYREVLIDSLEGDNANDRLVLGAPFLTSAYLLVDHHREHFTLWKSAPTTTSKIVAISAPDCQSANVATGFLPTSSAVDAAPRHTSVSGRTIAGSVIGGLAGAALFASMGFFLLRRRRNRVHDQKLAKESSNSARSVSPMLQKPELPSDRQPPQEMSCSRDPSFAIAPYEMAEGRLDRELHAEGPEPIASEMAAATPPQRSCELTALPHSPRSS